jgi:hypothetical protein
MIDSDNVLLLRLIHPTSGFFLQKGTRPPRNSSPVQEGYVGATIYYFHKPVTSDFIKYFENTIHPELMEANIALLSYFVTEDSPNTFPQLPVREGEYVFVWFAGFPNQDECEKQIAELENSRAWKEDISKYLRRHIKGKPEILRLTPTARSWLTGKP